MHATTAPIPAIDWYRPEDIPRDVYWVHDEHFPDPISPLYADFGPGNLSDDADLTELASPIPTKKRMVVDGYLYTGAPINMAPPTPQSIAAFEERLQQRQDLEVIRRWFEEVRPALVDRHERLCQVRPSDLDTPALLQHIRELAIDSRAAHRAHALNVRAVSLITKSLAQFGLEHLGLSALGYQELLAGSSTTTGGPVAAMEELANRVQLSAPLRRALASAEPWTDADIHALLQPYVDAFGHRLLQPDFLQPTLTEQPVAIISLLREAVARLDAGAGHAADNARSRAAERADALRARLTDADDRATFDRLLDEARRVHGVREDDQTFIAALRGFLRYALLEAGRRLVRNSVLDAPEQVWYLRAAELEEALAGARSDGLRDLAEQRLTEHQRQRERAPQAAYGAPPTAVAWAPMAPATRLALEALATWTVTAPATPIATTSAPAELRGMGASSGTYSGPARVISGPEEFDRVQPGDVLVCKISSPAWTIIFGRIGGIVTEVGSVLSHPAIAAREFGIPGVLSVADATTRIQDGEIVEVDGDAGVVRRVSHANSGDPHE